MVGERFLQWSIILFIGSRKHCSDIICASLYQSAIWSAIDLCHGQNSDPVRHNGLVLQLQGCYYIGLVSGTLILLPLPGEIYDVLVWEHLILVIGVAVAARLLYV
jgi:hypothetical protein